MTETARDRYLARMRRVLDHIDGHLDQDLALDALADVAAFSKFHFHRQFTATFGLSVKRYVQLARIKQASHRLAFNRNDTVTAIAFDAGYEAADAFARVFRQCIGQTPSAFRKEPDWTAWQTALEPLSHARKLKMSTQSYSAEDVAIVERPETRVAVMEHRGDPAGIPETIQRFIAWRRAHGLIPPSSATFTVLRCDPNATPPEAFRLDLCAGTNEPVAANDMDVEDGILPGGRFAMLRVIGHDDNLETPTSWLYREWLPDSGEEPGDFPIFCERTRTRPEVPANEAITELYLLLR